MKPGKLFSIMIIFSAMFCIACQLDVPIKDMVSAKKKISRAEEVSADRFDPESFKSATEHLLKAHEYLKDEKMERAADEARLASEMADRAIETSLPLKAAESIDAARARRELAVGAYAEKYAPEELAAADALLKEAISLSEQKDYWSAHRKALEAGEIFSRATESSLAHREELENRRNSLMARMQTMTNDPYVDIASEELAFASTRLQLTDDAIRADRFKDASLLMDEIEKLLDGARDSIEVHVAQLKAEELGKKKTGIAERIDMLRSEHAAISASAGAPYAEAELSAASASLDQAAAALEENPDKASEQCDSAAASIEIAKKLARKGELLARADALEQRRQNLAADPAAQKHQDKLSSASTLIADGRSMVESGSPDDGSLKLDEAESMLNAIETDPGKTETEPEAKETAGTGQNIYIVKYNPKNRDCLWRISQRVYGNARLWPFIYVANRDSIKDPDLIFPGQKLVIPPRPADGTKVKPGTEEKTVQPGADSAQ